MLVPQLFVAYLGPFLKGWPNLEVAMLIKAKLCEWLEWREMDSLTASGLRPTGGAAGRRGKSALLPGPGMGTSSWWECHVAPRTEIQMFPIRVGIVPRSGVACVPLQAPRCKSRSDTFLKSCIVRVGERDGRK